MARRLDSGLRALITFTFTGKNALYYFAVNKAHIFPLCVESRILPIRMLYSYLVFSIMHDINNISFLIFYAL